MWYIYTAKYYSMVKSNGFLKLASKWMKLEKIILSEVIQAQRDKYVLIYFKGETKWTVAE